VTRKIFFSFHYERDAWRAGQVRNSNVVSSEDRYGFIDAADWESIKKKGDAAIEDWIDDQLKNTSVTVVLIGAETSSREWVQYEILKSWNRGNGLVGIRIHNIKDQDQKTDVPGAYPFDDFKLPDGTLLSSVVKTYDWVTDEGRKNLGKWADDAANIRAEYATGDKITAATDSTSKVSVSSIRSSSVAFTPKSPWCSSDAQGRR
jgi:hypothetical protein